VSREPHWTLGPARTAAAAVLGLAGLAGLSSAWLADAPPSPITPLASDLRPVPASAPPPAPATNTDAEPAPASPAVRIDINSAGPAELDLLPGIGPVMAQRILDDRAANGPFATVDDLARVRGIGPKTLDALRDLVRAN
jgi:competence ComEA-like helix-hairpin-helix protein